MHIIEMDIHLYMLQFGRVMLNAKLLVKYDANFNDNYERNCTPLHIAIRRKQLEIVKLLIENGADINAKTNNRGKDDLTPMHLAIFVNMPEFIELLTNHGAIIDERESTEEHTPLHFAALYKIEV